MKKNIFLAMAVFLIFAACAQRRPPEKPLSEVLREERVAIPQGQGGAANRQPDAVVETLDEENLYDGIPVGIGADGRPYIGSASPSVVIAVFSDLQCPFCRVAHEKILSWARLYGSEVRFVYYHFPLSIHPHAMQYARIAVCASRMARFWPVVHALFNAGMQPVDVRNLARRFGLDERKLAECSMSRDVQALVDEDIAEGNRQQVRGTPTFVLEDGQSLYMDGIQNYLESRFK